MRTFIPAAIAAACVILAAPARADITFSIQSVSASAGDTGDTFDVLISNTGPDAVDVGGFSFEITTLNTDITFTDATTSTMTAEYIFDGNSLFGPDISNSAPGQTFDAADIVSTPNSYTALASGETLGLALIFFDVSPTATVPESVTVSFNPANSSLSDQYGNLIPIDTFDSGTIDVIVPEPSYAWPLAAGLGWLILRRRRRAINAG